MEGASPVRAQVASAFFFPVGNLLQRVLCVCLIFNWPRSQRATSSSGQLNSLFRDLVAPGLQDSLLVTLLREPGKDLQRLGADVVLDALRVAAGNVCRHAEGEQEPQ